MAVYLISVLEIVSVTSLSIRLSVKGHVVSSCNDFVIFPADVSYLLGLTFEPEDIGDIFRPNVG
jgi:hypothetical protein